MNISIRQLRAFVLGARSLSFSVAAARLGITQPGYSLLIRQLEDELGSKLFHRSTRRVELSTVGREMLPSAERTLEQLDEACRRAEALRAGKLGTLNLAVVPSVACSLLPGILVAFIREFPGVKLVFHEDLAVAFAERVRSGIAEIGLGLLLTPDDALTFEPLARDELVVVLHPDHPAARTPDVTWRLLASSNYISVTNQSSVRIHADRASAAAGVGIEPVHEVASLNTAVGLVRANLGYAILPSLAIASLKLDGTVVRTLDQPRASREIGLLTRREYALSPMAEAFAGTARRMLASSESGGVPPPTPDKRRRRRSGASPDGR